MNTDELPSPWLRAIVTNVQDAIVVLDSAGSVIFESPAAGEMLGAARSDPLGAFRLERVHPDERESVVEAFRRTIGVPGAITRATYRFAGADGRWRHLEAVGKNLVHEPYLHGVLVTFRDVSERIEALEAAERANRARDEFLSRMSHELRTPLHAILGWAQLLLGSGEARVLEAGEQIHGAGEHLLRLVEEALDLGAVQEGRITIQLERVSVSEAVSEAIELARPLAGARDVQVHLTGGCEPTATVVADRHRLRQVLLNLLSNAIKFNRYAGDVHVGWQSATDASVRIVVRDTGPGMDPDHLPLLFERFERLGMAEAGIEGSGLGLAISSRLVEMMGGGIGVESHPGEGATFWIEIPTTADCGEIRICVSNAAWQEQQTAGPFCRRRHKVR
jgi:PAS domain S-box-containing protein